MVRHLAHTPSLRAEPQYLYIEPGMGVKRVSRLAHDVGLVGAAWHFNLIVRLKGMDRSLLSGEYEVLPGQTLEQTLTQIRKRDVYLHRLVIPEGQSVSEVMDILKGAYGLDLDGLTAPVEGSLLPDTYFYERGDRAVAVVERMKNAMTEALLAAWEVRDADLPFASVEEALVMASIVEKETAVPSERPLVAAVFINRLRKGMRLQSDPTVIYGITGGTALDRPISRADLRAMTPYNTYRVSGLPPTAIANPGRESIKAVMNPADVPYLYFVADGTGGHAFASTLDEHNRNVARWRQIERDSR
ncbi:endolytic transglycosylase MltG [Kordiimonas lipolytica]|uniref:Endolytic murein transglycosylase n=1 Tax=Kordiimonas lipolytica TaxID=1662421 RepID=A0ABV8UBG1_9PROT|nr:endolytic transglycosylase MltG [Kordiimonas lipolytica]